MALHGALVEAARPHPPNRRLCLPRLDGPGGPFFLWPDSRRLPVRRDLVPPNRMIRIRRVQGEELEIAVMAVLLDQFVETLSQSGLMTAGQVQAFLDGLGADEVPRAKVEPKR